MFKRLMNASKNVKRVLSGTMAVAVAATSIFVGLSINAKAGSTRQEILEDLLGSALPYGIVAEEFTNSNHNQTTFAVNVMHSTDQYLSKWNDNPMGTIYIKSLANNRGNVLQLDAAVANNLVLGFPYDYSVTDNKIYELDNLMTRTGNYLNVANCRDINIYYDPYYMDVTATRTAVKNTFKSIAEMTDSEVDVAVLANDSRTIDISSFSNKKVVYVNLHAYNYMSGENKVSSFFSTDQLNIIGKQDDQIVIINLLDAEEDAEVWLQRIKINNKQESGNNSDICDTLIFNAVNINKLTIAEMNATFVAPDADVILQNTCYARVVAKTFENRNGELHFGPSYLAVETSTKPTEATTKATEATTVATEATTKATEATTKATEATTKATEDTTKATEDTTKATEATTKATEATTKATEATTKATEATTKATEATTKATEATTKATEATTKATEATTKATEATTAPANLAEANTTAATTKATEATTAPAKVAESNTKATTATSTTTASVTDKVDTANKVDTPNKVDTANKVDTSNNSDSSNMVDTDSRKPSAEVAADEESVTGSSVFTGDNSHVMIYVIILVLAVVIFGVTFVVSKKKSK